MLAPVLLLPMLLSIFGDHSDVYATRQTGFALLASGRFRKLWTLQVLLILQLLNQECLSFISLMVSVLLLKFRRLKLPATGRFGCNYMTLKALKQFRDRALNPEHPVTRGTAQNPDIFFQAKESSNKFYDAVPDVVEDYMQKISSLLAGNIILSLIMVLLMLKILLLLWVRFATQLKKRLITSIITG